MKIVILSDSVAWGGLETHALALAETAAASGHDAAIGCLGQEAHRLYRMMASDGVTLLELPRPLRQTPWNWWRALRDVEADAVVLEKGTLYTGGWALDVALRLKYGTFVAVQQLEPPVLPPRTRGRYAGGVIRGLGLWWYRWKWSGYVRSLGPRATICVSDAVRRRLLEDYAFAPHKTLTIPNGVDLARFQPRPEARRLAREAWGVPPDALVFGSLGRLHPQKGLDVAIEAFSRVAHEGVTRDAFLVLVGEGPEREALEAQARALGLAHRVILAGFMATPSVAYQGFDVFLIPSRYEGLPFSLVEAMASGCRVVGTTVGGIPEVITDPSMGTLVPPDDVAALAEAMVQSAGRGASTVASEIVAARARVASGFDIAVQCRKIVRLLEECHGPTRGVAPELSDRAGQFTSSPPGTM